MKKRVRFGTCLSIVLILVAGPAYADSGRTVVIPPHRTVYGKTYGDWSADWWRWELQTRVHTGSEVTHPLLTTGHVDCSIGQKGRVWFLGGQINPVQGNPVVERSCAIPEHKYLFFPVYDSWADNSNCDGLPPFTATEAQLRATVASGVDAVSQMSVTVDHETVKGLSTPSTRFRAQAPVFSYTTPADSLLNDLFCAPGTFAAQTVHGAVADGVYVMLAPMHEGRHTVHFTVEQGSAVILDVTYHLRVED